VTRSASPRPARGSLPLCTPTAIRAVTRLTLGMWVVADPEGPARPPPGMGSSEPSSEEACLSDRPGCRPASATPRRMRRTLDVTLEWRGPPRGRPAGPPGLANVPRAGSEESIRVPSAGHQRRPGGREAGLTRSSSHAHRGMDRGPFPKERQDGGPLASARTDLGPWRRRFASRCPLTGRRPRTLTGGSLNLVPRRRVPCLLRSAFAVFHDPGGLLLSEPSGVFQPVTLVEFDSRSGSTSRRHPAAGRPEGRFTA